MTSSGPASRRRDIICLCLLVGLWVALWLPRLTGPIDLRFDAGVYYILGTSLAEGNGYRLLNEPGEIEAVQYPPMLPLFVAAHQWVLGTSDYLVVGPWLRLFYFIVSGAYTLLVYMMARWYLSSRFALLVAVVSALFLYTYYLSDVLYSEIPFALVTTLFVMFNHRSERIGYKILTALMAMAAYLLRAAGIALFVAWVGESLLRGRLKQTTVRVVIVLIPVVLWQSYVADVMSREHYREPQYTYQRTPYYYSNVSYVENVRLINPFVPELGKASTTEISKRIAMNVTTIPVALGESVSMPIGSWKSFLRTLDERVGLKVFPEASVRIPITLLGCLVVAGAVLLVMQRRWFIPIYFVASVGMMCLTPWPEQFTRYLTPLTPFLALLLVYALAHIGEWSTKRFPPEWKKIGPAFGILLMTSVLLVQGLSLAKSFTINHQSVSYYDADGNEIVHRLFYYKPPWKALDTSLEWVRRHAGTKDVIATSVPHTAYVRTGLKAVLPPMEPDGDRAQDFLDSVPVKYLILDEVKYPGISQRYAAPAVENHPHLWKLVYVAPGGGARVYERIH